MDTAPWESREKHLHRQNPLGLSVAILLFDRMVADPIALRPAVMIRDRGRRLLVGLSTVREWAIPPLRQNILVWAKRWTVMS